MYSFRINEISKGESEETMEIPSGSLDLGGLMYRNLDLHLRFNKREAALQVDMSFRGEVELTCDRSLDSFWQQIEGQYTVLFKEGIDFESEDDSMTIKRLDISGNIINIDAEIRDSVMLSIPVRKIHPRYVDENGQLIEFVTTKRGDEVVDPRWEALKKLKDTTSNN